jgi:hypothetical protein
VSGVGLGCRVLGFGVLVRGLVQRVGIQGAQTAVIALEGPLGFEPRQKEVLLVNIGLLVLARTERVFVRALVGDLDDLALRCLRHGNGPPAQEPCDATQVIVVDVQPFGIVGEETTSQQRPVAEKMLLVQHAMETSKAVRRNRTIA